MGKVGIDAAMGIDERLDRVVSGIFAVGERSVGSRGAAWVDWARVQRDCALNDDLQTSIFSA